MRVWAFVRKGCKHPERKYEWSSAICYRFRLFSVLRSSLVAALRPTPRKFACVSRLSLTQRRRYPSNPDRALPFLFSRPWGEPIPKTSDLCSLYCKKRSHFPPFCAPPFVSKPTGVIVERGTNMLLLGYNNRGLDLKFLVWLSQIRW